MRLKRWIFPLITVVALVVTGCSDEGEAPAKQLILATGPAGGTYEPLGREIAQLWTKNIPGVSVKAKSTGASVENMGLLAASKADVVMAINGVAIDAGLGAGEFEGKQVKDIMAIGNIYPEVLQIITTKESGIKTVADLKGKKVSIGPKGSGTALAAQKVLVKHNLDAATDITPSEATFQEATDQLRKGEVDAAFAILALPADVIEKMGDTASFVEVSGDGLGNLLREDLTYTQLEIPAGTYPWQKEAVQTVTNWATLYARSSLPEKTAYEMAKTLYEKTGTIKHPVGKQIKLQSAIDGVDTIKVHPGAAKYYKEKAITAG